MSENALYALAPQGVFMTYQGEGVMLGEPMVFVRLAGCPVNCAGCDTNYTVTERLSPEQIAARVANVAYDGTKWVWVTGGEPTIYDLVPLYRVIRTLGYRVALATAGIRPAQMGLCWGGVDFLSVSPHASDTWIHRNGDQLNLVPRLNGLRLEDMEPVLDECEKNFNYRFVTPCEGVPGSLDDCLRFLRRRKGYRLGVQAHKVWGLP